MTLVLVTGASGLVGSRVMLRLGATHEVHGTYHQHSPGFLGQSRERLHRLDVMDLEAVRRTLDALAPEVVVHCAAATDVDGCEDDPGRAFAVNVAPTREIAAWAQRRGARVVLMSTDYVFDGTSPPYEVDARPTPLCVYSRSKADAESALRGVPGALTVRSTVIYGMDVGHHRRNFATWLMDELQAGRPVRVVSDQWNTPTISENIAEFIGRALDRQVEGVLHAACDECVARDEFARRVARRFGLPEDLIAPVVTRELNQRARRPLRPCLSMGRSRQLLGERAWTIAQSLDLLHRQLAGPDRSLLKPWW